MRVMLIVGALTFATVAGSTAAEADEAWIDSFAFACTTPEGETLKPKFGDIDGIFYPDLPAQREQCLETIQRKIVHCRDNVDFGSNTKNETYAPCLPIFAEQAEACVGHFTFERSKCDAGGYGTEAAGQAEDEAAPEESHSVATLDETMEVTTRANVRSGPGTGYDVLGTLDAGVGVRVTGVVEGGKWMRVDLREDGGPAFIHTSLLKEVAPEAVDQAEVVDTPESQDATAALSPKCTGSVLPVYGCWFEFDDPPGCYAFTPYYTPEETGTWSGVCQDGLAVGQGTWEETTGYYSNGQATGTLVRGKMHGPWVWRSDSVVQEGPYVDGKMHGCWVIRWLYGDKSVEEGPFVDDKRHGRWVFRFPDGFNGIFRDDNDDGYFDDHERYYRNGKEVAWNALSSDGAGCDDVRMAPPDATMEETAPEASDAPLEPVGPNWIVAENQPCQLRNPYPVPDETVTWTGPCVDGKASGQGRFVWRHSDGVDTYEGSMRDGAPHGHGTYTQGFNGFRYEGEWRDFKRHGQVILTLPDGEAQTCEWRDDERVDGTCEWHSR